MPISWAKMDIRTLSIIQELIKINESSCNGSLGKRDIRVDATVHVVRRQEIARNNYTLGVSKAGVPYASFAGTVLQCHSTDSFNDVSMSIVLHK